MEVRNARQKQGGDAERPPQVRVHCRRSQVLYTTGRYCVGCAAAAPAARPLRSHARSLADFFAWSTNAVTYWSAAGLPLGSAIHISATAKRSSSTRAPGRPSASPINI